MCSNAEIIAAIWEDDGDHYSYLKKCKKVLLSILTQAGCKEVLISQSWGEMANAFLNLKKIK